VTNCGRLAVDRATLSNEVDVRQRELPAHAGVELTRFEGALQVELPNFLLRRDAWELISSLRNAVSVAGRSKDDAKSSPR
jgi:hypothetical protein